MDGPCDGHGYFAITGWSFGSHHDVDKVLCLFSYDEFFLLFLDL